MDLSKSHSALCLALLVAVGVAGCGGGGGANAVRAGAGTLVVTVTDALGAPASDAAVLVRSDSSDRSWLSPAPASTDANGQVRFTSVPAGRIHASSSSDSPVNAWGSAEADLTANAQVELAVVVRPTSDWDGGPGGIGAAHIDRISADGRSLEFSLRVYDFGQFGPDNEHPDFGIGSCTPDPSNDAPVHHADCVIGPVGFDAAYSAESLSSDRIANDTPASFSAALLVDQSQRLADDDPWDNRLFGLKFFLVSKAPADRVLLAAFASDNLASGLLSQLPQKPVTLFPVENPAFTTASNSLFSTIDSLESLEGGAAPLYAAIDAMLDYVSANTSTDDRRAVAVLTDGSDDTCGTPTQCDDARTRVGDKSSTLAVPLVIVALNGPSELARLATRSGGVVLWAFDPSDLGPVFGRLPAILNGTETSYDAHFRIQSTTDGAFQSGRTVMGSLGWGWVALPFAVEIP